MYGLFKIFRNIPLTVKQKCDLFDSMCLPVLSYGSQVWGFHRASEIDLIHNKFCRDILGLSKTSSVDAMLGELGRLPLHIKRKEYIIKYWYKILQNTDSLIYIIYNLLLQDANDGKTNWVLNIKNLTCSLGFSEYWYNQNPYCINIELVLQRLRDQYVQQWFESIKEKSKLNIYVNVKYMFNFEFYLQCLCNEHLTILSKLRCGNLKLNVETGRYTNITRHLRICSCCNINVTEDEYHFILICPAYRHIRIKHIPTYYNHWPTIKKLYGLLSTTKKVYYYLYQNI